MTADAPTIITTDDQPCPGCDHADGVYWIDSTPDSDTWACRHCATEWTITVCAWPSTLSRSVPTTTPLSWPPPNTLTK